MGDDPGFDGFSVLGELIDNGNVEIAVESQGNGAGNGGGAHGEAVRVGT